VQPEESEHRAMTREPSEFEPTGTTGSLESTKPDLRRVGNAENVMAGRPADDPALVAALRCFLSKRPEEAIDRLKDLDKPNQDMLLVLLPLAARLTEGSLAKASAQEINALIEGLNGLLTPLRAQAPLTISKMCFCRSVNGFGKYDPWPDDHRFIRGDRALIYLELQNFASREMRLPSGQIRHVVQLVSSAEIRDFTGKKVWPGDIIFQRDGSDADASRTPRNDYCDGYGFWVPDIQPGSYTLWIHVEDRGTNPPRIVQGSLDFHVAIPAGGS
jgi:hypothetical protein